MRLLRAVAVWVVLATSFAAPAHPGGVDASGCHTNRKTGVAHCHGTPKAAPRLRSPSPLPASPSRSRAPIVRSRSARAEFMRAHPCPVNGNTKGPCPGWEVDHIMPLACGGADTPLNMQWLTATENRRKGAMGCRRN